MARSDRDECRQDALRSLLQSVVRIARSSPVICLIRTISVANANLSGAPSVSLPNGQQHGSPRLAWSRQYGSSVRRKCSAFRASDGDSPLATCSPHRSSRRTRGALCRLRSSVTAGNNRLAGVYGLPFQITHGGGCEIEKQEGRRSVRQVECKGSSAVHLDHPSRLAKSFHSASR